MLVSDNPMVALNRAIAVAMVHGPGAGLAVIDTLDADVRIAGHYRLDAVRGHLYERSGDLSRAVHHYRLAAERTSSLPERDYLTGKALAVARAMDVRVQRVSIRSLSFRRFSPIPRLKQLRGKRR